MARAGLKLTLNSTALKLYYLFRKQVTVDDHFSKPSIYLQPWSGLTRNPVNGEGLDAL